MAAKAVPLNALDRLIGWVSPAAGARRARARAALGMIRSYEGAKTGRRTAGWVAGSTSANAEIGPSLVALRNRSRELIRDNGFAAKAAAAFVGNAVGTGITLKLSDGQDLWSRWIKECDADGQHDFFGLQALVARTLFESGECLVRLRWRRPEDGLSVPLQLQVLEPDYIDNLKNETLPNGGWILNGIEFDAIGKRAAYWLYASHPGDSAPILKSLVSRRVPASDVLHIYEKTRPGQVRGVPRLAPAMLRMRDLDDYEEAELLRKGLEACFAVIITEPEGDSGTVTGAKVTDGSGNEVENIGAGAIIYSRNGQDVKFGAPQHLRGYEDYVRRADHYIAAGAGLTHELLTGDLSQVNYSSIRAGLLEFRRTIDQFRWLTFIPMLCEPIATAWVDAARLSGALRARTVTHDWTPPRWDWVDPVKDVAGELLEVAAGLKPWQEAVRARGFDPLTNIAQIKEDQERFKTAGISILIDQLALGAAQAAARDTQGAKP